MPKWISDRVVKQIVDVAVPEILEKNVEVEEAVLEERVRQHTVEPMND